MSLGVLGQYGSESGSSISDSDEDYDRSRDHTNATEPSPIKEDNCLDIGCTDPLSLGLEGSVSEDSNNSSSESGSPPPPLPVDSQAPSIPLPLPDIDRIVARNASYSSSELVSKAGSRDSCDQTIHAGTEENSVFFNPYKKAEHNRLAILKHHVSEFDKKPGIKEKKVAWNENFHIRSSDRSGAGPSRVEIPPPVTYGRHLHTQSSPGSAQVRSPQSSNPPPGGVSAVSHAEHPAVPMHGRHLHHYQEGGEMRGEDLFDDKDSSILVNKPRKHRSGVGDSLTPPKKFMKMHQQIQARERPWTLKD